VDFLVATPLRWLHTEVLLGSVGVLAGKLGSKLGQSSLVPRHVDSQALKVGKLVGETNSTTVDKHPVARAVGNLVDLQDTLVLHGLLCLHEEVLAQAHWPATAHLGDHIDVLVHKAVDLGHRLGHLDVLSTKDGWQGAAASTDALTLDSLDRCQGRHRHEEVTERGEVAALALGNVVLQLAAASSSIRLKGEVVVCNLLVVALNSLEELVGTVLDLLGNLDQERLLGGSKMCTGTIGDLLCASLTNLDGTDDLLVEVGLDALGLLADEGAIPLGSSLVALDYTSETCEQSLRLLVVCCKVFVKVDKRAPNCLRALRS